MKKQLLVVTVLASLAGCDKPEPEPETDRGHALPELTQEYRALEAAFAGEAETPLRKLGVSAPGFLDAVEGLLNNPEAERLETAHNAWRTLYRHWNRAFVVAAAQAVHDPQRLAALLRSDPLPIMPGYVDGLSLWPESGIVHDVTVPLDRDSLLAQQDMTAEGEASVGFQVLRFLLFGEPDKPRQPDALSIASMDAEANGEAEDLPANRRRAYLHTAANLLAEDLSLLAEPARPAGRDLARALSDALALASERRLLLDDLADYQDPAAGEFLAPESREIALEELNEALAYWFTGDGRAPLLAVYRGLAPEFATALRHRLEQQPLVMEEIHMLLNGRPQVLR